LSLKLYDDRPTGSVDASSGGYLHPDVSSEQYGRQASVPDVNP
jgi:hypothetical protein